MPPNKNHNYLLAINSGFDVVVFTDHSQEKEGINKIINRTVATNIFVLILHRVKLFTCRNSV